MNEAHQLVSDFLESELGPPEFLDRLSYGNLFEGGLSRINTLAKEPFAVITAWRQKEGPGKDAPPVPTSVNRANNRTVLKALNQAKMGPHLLLGYWDEPIEGWSSVFVSGQRLIQNDETGEQLTPDEAKERGISELGDEESFFVPKPAAMDIQVFFDEMLAVARRFKQDAFLFGDGEDIYAVNRAGKKSRIGSGTSFAKTGPDGWSRLRNRPQIPFVFEGTAVPMGGAGRRLFAAVGLSYFGQA